MPIDMHKLDKFKYDDSETEESWEKFQDALLQQFYDSPEGQARLKDDPDMGFWAAQLIEFGFNYIGISVPKMRVADIREIVTELFPRKISLSSSDDANDAIPELVAFWQYLQREYQLANAESVLNFLNQIKPAFNKLMNDSSKFGMAKSFFMLGQSQGYDMTSQRGMDEFMLEYNTKLLQQSEPPTLPSAEPAWLGSGLFGSGLSQHRKTSKNKRKMEKQSRKKNRKKK